MEEYLSVKMLLNQFLQQDFFLYYCVGWVLKANLSKKYLYQYQDYLFNLKKKKLLMRPVILALAP